MQGDTDDKIAIVQLVLLYTAGTSGSVSFSDLLPGSYILRIKSRARDSDETAVIRRVIHISKLFVHMPMTCNLYNTRRSNMMC